jgi:hypothetical protein
LSPFHKSRTATRPGDRKAVRSGQGGRGRPRKAAFGTLRHSVCPTLSVGQVATAVRDNRPLSGHLICRRPFRFLIATKPRRSRDKGRTETGWKGRQAPGRAARPPGRHGRGQGGAGCPPDPCRYAAGRRGAVWGHSRCTLGAVSVQSRCSLRSVSVQCRCSEFRHTPLHPSGMLRDPLRRLTPGMWEAGRASMDLHGANRRRGGSGRYLDGAQDLHGANPCRPAAAFIPLLPAPFPYLRTGMREGKPREWGLRAGYVRW